MYILFLKGKQESSARCERYLIKYYSSKFLYLFFWSAISEYKPDVDNNIPFTTLRIRSHDGQQTYVIKMKTTCTIKDVKQIIAKKK